MTANEAKQLKCGDVVRVWTARGNLRKAFVRCTNEDGTKVCAHLLMARGRMARSNKWYPAVEVST